MQSLPLMEEQPQALLQAGGSSPGKQLCRKRPGGPSGQQADGQPVPSYQRRPVVSWAALGGALPSGRGG